MANSLEAVTPRILARGLKALRENCVMARLVNRSFDSEAARQGSTVDVRKPKTLSEKMTELKKGSMGALFERQTRPAGGGMANGTTIQSNGRPVKLFSIEDARSGRASIDDIASGKAFVR